MKRFRFRLALPPPKINGVIDNRTDAQNWKPRIHTSPTAADYANHSYEGWSRLGWIGCDY